MASLLVHTFSAQHLKLQKQFAMPGKKDVSESHKGNMDPSK